jgi:hypothetical protein
MAEDIQTPSEVEKLIANKDQLRIALASLFFVVVGRGFDTAQRFMGIVIGLEAATGKSRDEVMQFLASVCPDRFPESCIGSHFGNYFAGPEHGYRREKGYLIRIQPTQNPLH